MPPELDIYGLTTQRTLDTINYFLDSYVDRIASEDRGDEELMIARLDRVLKVDDPNAYEWELARTLSHTIQRGLDYPRRSFALYLPAKHPYLARTILKFTTDDQLILGLSVNNAETQAGDEEQAKQLLTTLFEHYHCHLGLIAAEMAPPDDELDFRTMALSPLVMYFQAVRP